MDKVKEEPVSSNDSYKESPYSPSSSDSSLPSMDNSASPSLSPQGDAPSPVSALQADFEQLGIHDTSSVTVVQVTKGKVTTPIAPSPDQRRMVDKTRGGKGERPLIEDATKSRLRSLVHNRQHNRQRTLSDQALSQAMTGQQMNYLYQQPQQFPSTAEGLGMLPSGNPAQGQIQPTCLLGPPSHGTTASTMKPPQQMFNVSQGPIFQQQSSPGVATRMVHPGSTMKPPQQMFTNGPIFQQQSSPAIATRMLHPGEYIQQPACIQNGNQAAPIQQVAGYDTTSYYSCEYPYSQQTSQETWSFQSYQPQLVQQQQQESCNYQSARQEQADHNLRTNPFNGYCESQGNQPACPTVYGSLPEPQTDNTDEFHDFFGFDMADEEFRMIPDSVVEKGQPSTSKQTEQMTKTVKQATRKKIKHWIKRGPTSNLSVFEAMECYPESLQQDILNYINEEKLSLLSYALYYKREDAMRALVQRKANIMIRHMAENSILHLAAFMHAPIWVRKVIEIMVNILPIQHIRELLEMKNFYGMTCRDVLVKRAQRYPIEEPEIRRVVDFMDNYNNTSRSYVQT